MHLALLILSTVPALVATISNSFSVLGTFKVRNEVNRDQISKHQKIGVTRGSQGTMTPQCLAF